MIIRLLCKIGLHRWLRVKLFPSEAVRFACPHCGKVKIWPYPPAP